MSKTSEQIIDVLFKQFVFDNNRKVITFAGLYGISIYSHKNQIMMAFAIMKLNDTEYNVECKLSIGGLPDNITNIKFKMPNGNMIELHNELYNLFIEKYINLTR